MPGLQPAPSLGYPERERFRLFDSITTFLKNASRSWPLVVIFDNLHWAGKTSLMLLERDGAGDKAKATSLLDESLLISTDLGMRPLMERVLSRRKN